VGVKVYVAATLERRSVDLYMVDRSATRIMDRSFDVEGLHYTWRDGEKQHLDAESGDLADTVLHPDLVAAVQRAWGNTRLWAVGLVRRWAGLSDVHQTGSRIYHADELMNFPLSKPRKRVINVDLGHGEHVEVAHYLVRPGAIADEFLATQSADPEVQVEVIDGYVPWSVVTAWRFDDRGFTRALGAEQSTP
jgi:hypothetical protein